MNKSLTFIIAIFFYLTMGFMPKSAFGQGGDPTDPVGQPFWEGGGTSGGIGGFGSNVPDECVQLNDIRNQISSNGLLGTIHKIGEFTWDPGIEGGWGPLPPPGGGQGGHPFPPPGGGQGGYPPPGGGQGGYGGGAIGQVVGGIISGLFGGGGKGGAQDATKKAVEELTKVQMTNLVEAECHSILQDIYLTMLGETQMEKLNDSEYRNSDIQGAIETVREARDNIGYLRQYIADEYRLLYDIRGRHQEYEENPGYWKEVKDKFADYSIEEADDLIIAARENQLMTGQTKQYIDVLTGMLGKDDLTPGQTQQLEGYISAVHASEMTQMKNILAGQAAFIAQTEAQRKQKEKDRYWFELKGRDINDTEVDLMNQSAETSKKRFLIPPWAGDNQ